MDWGPVITGILTAILIVLSLPFLTDDIDEVVSNQQELLLQQPKATSLIHFFRRAHRVFETFSIWNV